MAREEPDPMRDHNRITTLPGAGSGAGHRGSGSPKTANGARGRRLPALGSAAVIALGLVSCGVVQPAKVNELFKDELHQRGTEYRIKPGDAITLKFFGGEKVATLNQELLLVLPDGRTDPFFLDNEVVSGKTIRQFEEQIRTRYAAQLRNAEISILVAPAEEFIFLHGEVVKPGTQPYSLRMTLSQAIANAHGYKVTASADEVILKRSYRNPRHPDVFVVSLYDPSEEVLLLPNDEIIVERTIWILLRDYLQEYIYGLFPFSHLSSLLFAAGAA